MYFLLHNLETQEERLMDEHTEFRQMEATKQMRQVQRRNVNPPHFPWPTSKPGPMVTPPPPGTKPMPLRTEQVAEIGYDQERGMPSTDDPGRWHADETKVGATSFDQLRDAEEAMRKTG